MTNLHTYLTMIFNVNLGQVTTNKVRPQHGSCRLGTKNVEAVTPQAILFNLRFHLPGNLFILSRPICCTCSLVNFLR